MKKNCKDNCLTKDETTSKVLCSVCVASYKRPELLRELLDSLYRQCLPGNVKLEIVLIDNDVERSAEPVTLEYSDRENIELHYYVQPVKSISHARNLGVEKARGDYILFIDDDEKASSEWVKYLLGTLEKFSADGAFGYVEPIFNDQAPDWIKRRDLFFYGDMSETGTKALATYTSNCILKAPLLKEREQPFDLSYGNTGGEDIQLFQRLVREGAKFVNCREAIVTEFVPPNRTRMSYFFTRALSGGNRNTRNVIQEAYNNRFFMRMAMLLKSLVYGVVSLLLFMVMFPNKVARTKWMVKFASNIGRFMSVFGWHYKFYN